MNFAGIAAARSIDTIGELSIYGVIVSVICEPLPYECDAVRCDLTRAT